LVVAAQIIQTPAVEIDGISIWKTSRSPPPGAWTCPNDRTSKIQVDNHPGLTLSLPLVPHLVVANVLAQGQNFPL
jgi:hypothetical protein